MGNFKFLVECKVIKDIVFCLFWRLFKLEVKEVFVKKFFKVVFLLFFWNWVIVLYNFFKFVSWLFVFFVFCFFKFLI